MEMPNSENCNGNIVNPSLRVYDLKICDDLLHKVKV